ncbi:hypothetical protein BDQ17DRAFT_1332281 [Cyathus striatus]|nr:hypothetical protein BDQ17DRAFT_1332281 [Cyathus striatus]
MHITANLWDKDNKAIKTTHGTSQEDKHAPSLHWIQTFTKVYTNAVDKNMKKKALNGDKVALEYVKKHGIVVYQWNWKFVGSVVGLQLDISVTANKVSTAEGAAFSKDGQFVGVPEEVAKGDATMNDTEDLKCGDCKIIFDDGTYIVTYIITIPGGSRVVGEWAVIRVGKISSQGDTEPTNMLIMKVYAVCIATLNRQSFEDERWTSEEGKCRK